MTLPEIGYIPNNILSKGWNMSKDNIKCHDNSRNCEQLTHPEDKSNEKEECLYRYMNILRKIKLRIKYLR